jgi:hypothetical protein
MLPSNLQFIRDAATVKSQPPRVIMDGIIKSSLNPFQRGAVDGLIASAMPHDKHEPQGHAPLLTKGKGKASATKKVDGMMSYPGAGGKKAKGMGQDPSSAGLRGSLKSM